MELKSYLKTNDCNEKHDYHEHDVFESFDLERYESYRRFCSPQDFRKFGNLL